MKNNKKLHAEFVDDIINGKFDPSLNYKGWLEFKLTESRKRDDSNDELPPHVVKFRIEELEMKCEYLMKQLSDK